MKRIFFLLVIIQLTGICVVNAQRPWKEYLVPGTLMFFSGLSEGTNEALVFHYNRGFKQVFSNASDQFWNPKISWRNKYKDGNPASGEAFLGSSTVFVGFTDGYHMLRTSKLAMDMGALVYCANNNHKDKSKYKFVNWKTVAQDFLVLSVIRTIGFHVTYSWVFNDPHYKY